jgi:hypothetical protein
MKAKTNASSILLLSIITVCLFLQSCVEYRSYYIINNGKRLDYKQLTFDGEQVAVRVSARYRLGLRIQSAINYEISNNSSDTVQIFTDRVLFESKFYNYVLFGANLPDRLWDDEKPTLFKGTIIVLPKSTKVVSLYLAQETLSNHGIDENEILTLKQLGIFTEKKMVETDSIAFVTK